MDGWIPRLRCSACGERNATADVQPLPRNYALSIPGRCIKMQTTRRPARLPSQCHQRFKMLTSRETQALEAILDDAIIRSKKEDDGDPVFHEVDANDVNPFADKRTQSDVYTSLAMKGYIECSGSEDPSGGETLENVCITLKGLEALKSVKGVN